MKKAFLFLIIILTIPAAFADIAMTTDQPVYNLGNLIKASASVMLDKDFSGLFKLTITCGNYKFEYYKRPVSLEANFRTAYDVPELPTTDSMKGNCTIIGDLVTNDNLIVEEKETSSFGVTSQLAVLPVNSRIIALPGDAIKVSGVVNEAYGNNVLKAQTKISLDNMSYTVDAVNGEFNLSVAIPLNIKSGRHTIAIGSSDSKGNSGSSSMELSITPVPTYIKTDVSSDKLMPGSVIEITPSLYDQANDLINTSIDIEMDSPSGTNVFRKAAQSAEKTNYEFSQYSEPGNYALASTYGGLSAKSLINISIVRNVIVRYENETVFVENTGNVVYEDQLTFMVESGQKKYPVTSKVKVEPGKTISIDLSKEVPLGIYDVLIPIKEGLNPVTANIDQKLQNVLNSTQQSLSNLIPPNTDVLASNVTIHDNRPVYKKVLTGLGSISGALVGADGVLAKSPLAAPIILVVIVLALVFRYGRKPIMRIIKGRKEDDKDYREEEH